MKKIPSMITADLIATFENLIYLDNVIIISMAHSIRKNWNCLNPFGDCNNE